MRPNGNARERTGSSRHGLRRGWHVRVACNAVSARRDWMRDKSADDKSGARGGLETYLGKDVVLVLLLGGRFIGVVRSLALGHRVRRRRDDVRERPGEMWGWMARPFVV